MKWWNDQTKKVTGTITGAVTTLTGKGDLSWWIVVIKEPTMGDNLFLSDVSQCKPFTGEHRTKIEHKHDDADGGSVYILFEQAATGAAASSAALAEIRVYQKEDAYTQMWQDINSKWSEKDREAKERKRRGAYATIGDLEDALAAHETKIPLHNNNIVIPPSPTPISVPEPFPTPVSELPVAVQAVEETASTV